MKINQNQVIINVIQYDYIFLMLLNFINRYRLPLASYIGLLVLITTLRFFINPGLVLSISATYMLMAGFVLGHNDNLLALNKKGFIKGLLFTVIILLIYISCFKLFSIFTGKELGIREFTYSFILVQFLLVALPEEVFFRGYLQNEFGNDISAIIIASFLFASAHLITICASGTVGVNTCVQNGLTFFPSLVMGYLYLRTRTLWSSILFHFFANIVHILMIIH